MAVIKTALSGALGTMGRVITQLASEPGSGVEIIAGADNRAGIGTASASLSYPVFEKIVDLPRKPAVVLDFSHPGALPDLLSYCRTGGTALVIATTGYSERETALIKSAAADIPVFFTANMSLGINLLAVLAKQAAAVLGGHFDIEIVEKHHNQKKDAPSGTALMLAKAVADSENARLVYDRHSARKARDPDEIGIHSIRGGTIVGEHDVIFAGHDEVITLSHAAASKEVFAAGALSAVRFIAGKKPGLYDMNDVVN